MTLNLTLTNPHDAYDKIHCNLENLSNSQHTNYMCHWCLYDIDVVQSVAYLILTAVDFRSASIWDSTSNFLVS